MTAVCVMVLGTTSGAGKSWLTTALCRHYARQGLKVGTLPVVQIPAVAAHA